MSKELPYFKFNPTEWLMGSISEEPDHIQGIFVQICCIYWSKSCSLRLLNAYKRMHKRKVNALLTRGLIKVVSDEIRIEFLDEQYKERLDIHKVRVKAGLASVEAKRSTKQAYKDKDKEEDKDKIKEKVKKEIELPFKSDQFREAWDELLKSKKWNKKSEAALKASLKKLSKHSEQVAIQAVLDALAGEWQGVFPESVKIKPTEIQNVKAISSAKDLSDGPVWLNPKN